MSRTDEPRSAHNTAGAQVSPDPKRASLAHADASQVSDPQALRALAHPLRLQLLEYLQEVGTATATQAAEYTGESAASCSFHLRQLAKYGFIERAEGQGREKPWRAVVKGMVSTLDKETPGADDAVIALAKVHVGRQFNWALENLAALRANPELYHWLERSLVSTQTTWLTPDELSAYNEELIALAEKYSGRELPDQRPADAQRVKIVTVAARNVLGADSEAL